MLKCQVTANSSEFSINWHYSLSQPDSSKIADQSAIQDTPQTQISTTINETSLLTELSLNSFSDKNDGYYWCSVNSSDQITHNPSVVLHIVYQVSECEDVCEAEQEIGLFARSSMPRYADEDISVDVVEAQNCVKTTSLRTTSVTVTNYDSSEEPTNTSSGSQATKLVFLPTTFKETTNITNTTTNGQSFPLTTEMIFGIAMGGLFILTLTVVIGLVCKFKKRRSSLNVVATRSPFDNIRMYCSNTNLEKIAEGLSEENTDRVSKILCDTNMSYECPHAATAQATENIYEYIN